MLQDKSSTNALEFTWDSLYAELQIRAPNVLKTVSAMVTDIPIQVNEKPFQHIMYSVSQILHGRSQEMSLVQYLSGFVLLHGGCTLKVNISCIGIQCCHLDFNDLVLLTYCTILFIHYISEFESCA